MRTISTLVLVSFSSLCLASITPGCGGDDGEDAESYDTFQDCFDDHTMAEMLPTVQAIAVCCLDHPIAGVHPSCGDTEAACETYVGANLAAGDASASDVTSACTTYISEKNM
ncbi:MAG TPA: hypothetical protein VHE35_00520 [Kofleriaceae bacterium]|nr:hypothetical protein [Kofleriaceae bacterium]